MSLALTSVFLVLVTSAGAQASDTPAAAARPSDAPSAPLSTPPLPSASDPCARAEADYTQAFDALVKGQDEQALAALERVLALCPTHPYASELARLERARLTPGAKLAQAAVLGMEEPTRFARGSLVVWQTLHGATQGALLCAIADCEGRAFLGASLVGAGIGAGVSWLITDHTGITPGQSGAINSGTSWGVWYGIALHELLDTNDGKAQAGLVMAGMVSLTGVGIAIAVLGTPTAGQVSMANSGGLWAGVVPALFLAALDGGSTKTFFAIETAVSTAGILTFAVLSASYLPSQGRVLLIDSGGILGGLLGAAAVAIAGANGQGVAVGAGLGALAGLGLTTYITRDFDAPDTETPRVALAPAVMGRGGAGLAIGGRF
ncbi:MAG: hypothetical protein ACJ8AT_24820 [Hyalangium sp.]|uniref:hypothetical protein n=1 Tax=Hyalangium sp. TaxID=2028555 RepID=UPI00389A18A4